MSAAVFSVMTANTPGAVGIIQVYGDGAAACVEQLCGVRPDARCRLAQFDDIDEGLVVGLNSHWCQIMPHGGVRVMQRLCDALGAVGAQSAETVDAYTAFPEASSALEAEMLATLAKAASPAAIPLLLAQPDRWVQAARYDDAETAAISDRLDGLVEPATVAVVGRANVGKSTLTNLMMGRAASLVADLPGTTRDWVAGMARIAMPVGEVVVRWFDTPGLRHSDDPIEQRAIQLARRVVAEADVLIAMRDVHTDWPAEDELPREPDVWVVNKCDLAPASVALNRSAVTMSAMQERGIDDLCAAVARALGLDALPTDPLWAFCPSLRSRLTTAD